MTRGLVLLDDAAVRHAINDRHSRIIGRSGIVCVASISCRNDLLDFGANQRPQARVVCPALVVLARALSCLR